MLLSSKSSRSSAAESAAGQAEVIQTFFVVKGGNVPLKYPTIEGKIKKRGGSHGGTANWKQVQPSSLAACTGLISPFSDPIDPALL